MSKRNGSSLFWTTINFSKLCIGSGVLALPYAATQGGLLLTPLGLIFVGAWNVLSCKMMIECKYACSDMVYPPEMTSTFTKIAFSGLGKAGAILTGFCVIVCLMGVSICYQISFALMMTGLPESFNPLSDMDYAEQTLCYIYLSAILVYPIACARNVQFLSPISFVALICLALGLLVLVVFGYEKVYWIEQGGGGIFQWPSWPASISDGSSYMGIALYCYGLCVICFPIEESMQNKREFPKALMYSCVFVTVFYALVGDVLSAIYQFDPNGVSQNILQNLPATSHAAAAVRCVMAMVCLLSFPLSFLPPAQIIEQQVWNSNFSATFWSSTSGQQFPYEPIGQGQGQKRESAAAASRRAEPSMLFRCGVRFVLVAVCALLAAHVPCFGMVISLLGSIGVTILSFVLPPLLHSLLVTGPQRRLLGSNGTHADLPYYFDIFVTLVGSLLCVGCTYYTIYGAYGRYLQGEMC